MKPKWLILLLLMLYSTPANCQEAKYLIRNYDIQNTLAINGSVWCMVQDTLGIIYFGVEEAIISYNGSEWKVFANGREDIRSLYADSKGNIWYGTVNEFGKVKRSGPEGIKLEPIIDLFPEKARQFGDLWSISELDSKIFFQSKTRIFVYESDEKVSCFDVKDSYHRGYSINGLYIINEAGVGLTHYTSDGFMPLKGGDFYRDKAISGAVVLTADSILFGTRVDGVFVYDRVSGNSSSYFNRFPETNDFLRQNRIYQVLILPDGNFAFATLLNGTLITSREGMIQKNLHYQSGVQDNTHYNLGLSYDHNLWICTGNGISSTNIYSPFSNWDYGMGLEGVVMSIQSHLDGILVGTLTGLFFLPEPNNLQEEVKRILNSEVWDILCIENDGKERKIISSGDGLYILEGEKITQTYMGELILKSIQLKSDPSIILSFGTNHLHVSRVTRDGFEYLMAIPDLFSEFRTIAQEGERWLWVGTRSWKMIRIDQKDLLRSIGDRDPGMKITKDTYTFKTLTDAHNINNQVIFSNSAGFLVFDSLQHSFMKCTHLGSDLASYSKMVSAMNSDARGNIWVGGNELLLNRQDGTYAIHKLPFDHVRDIFSAFAFHHDKEGRTWIGGNRGLYLFDNSVVSPPYINLPMIIDRIIFNDSTLYIYRNDCPGETTDDLSFSNGKNITIFFSLPKYTGENNTEYSFFLEGLSEDWSKWSGQHFATFNNLPSGNYEFRIKSKAPGSSESEPVCVSFKIMRPWYSTFLAKALYTIIALLILYLMNSISIRKRVRKEMLIENVIQKRLQQSIITGLVSDIKKGQPLPSRATLQDKPVENTDIDSEPVTASKEQVFMNQLLDTIEANMSDCGLSVERLCELMNMSQTMLYRKLKAHTGLSINSFIRKMRLTKGAQLLLQSDLSVSEIAYKVGFNDPGYFAKCFHSEFGQSPTTFQKNTINPSSV